MESEGIDADHLEQAFLEWFQHILPSSQPLTNFQDLCDGLIFIELLEPINPNLFERSQLEPNTQNDWALNKKNLNAILEQAKIHLNSILDENFEIPKYLDTQKLVCNNDKQQMLEYLKIITRTMIYSELKDQFVSEILELTFEHQNALMLFLQQIMEPTHSDNSLTPRRLLKKIDEFQLENESLLKQLNSLKEEKEASEKEFVGQIKFLQDEIDTLKTENSDVFHKYGIRSHETIDDYIKFLQLQVEQLTKESDKVQLENSNKEKVYQEELRLKEKQLARAAKIEQNLEYYKQKFEEKSKQVIQQDQIEKELKEQQDQMKNKEQQLLKLQQKIESIENKHKETQQQIISQRIEIQQKDQQIESLKLEVRESRERLQKQEELLQEQRSRMRQDTSDSMSSFRQNLNSDVQGYIIQLENEIQNLKGQVFEKKVIESLQNNFTEKEKDFQIEELNKNLEKLITENQQLKDKLSSFDSLQIKEILEQLNEEKQKSMALRRENNKLQTKMQNKLRSTAKGQENTLLTVISGQQNERQNYENCEFFESEKGLYQEKGISQEKCWNQEKGLIYEKSVGQEQFQQDQVAVSGEGCHQEKIELQNQDKLQNFNSEKIGRLSSKEEIKGFEKENLLLDSFSEGGNEEIKNKNQAKVGKQTSKVTKKEFLAKEKLRSHKRLSISKNELSFELCDKTNHQDKNENASIEEEKVQLIEGFSEKHSSQLAKQLQKENVLLKKELKDQQQIFHIANSHKCQEIEILIGILNDFVLKNKKPQKKGP